MIRFGYISELDTANGLVRVKFDGEGENIVSNPLPVSVPASKSDKYSFPFAINEHVWCMMDENGEYGVVGGAIYSAKNKPPSDVADHTIDIVLGASKLQVKIDREAGNLTLNVSGDISIKAGGNVKVEATGAVDIIGSTINATASSTATVKATSVTVDAPVSTMTGSLTVVGSVTAATIAAGGYGGMAAGAPMVVTVPMEVSGTASISGKISTDSGIEVAGDIETGGNIDAGGTIDAAGKITSAIDVEAGGKTLLTHIHTAPGGMSPAPTSPPIS